MSRDLQNTHTITKSIFAEERYTTLTFQDLVHRSFTGKNGDTEHFFSMTAPENLGFKEQIRHIEDIYEQKLQSLGLSVKTAVFRRIFLSDIVNQFDILKNSSLQEQSEDDPVAVSIIQQPPAFSKIAVIAYHIESKGNIKKERLSPEHLLVSKGGLKHLWSTGVCAKDTDKYFYPASQTRHVFVNLINTLNALYGNLYNNCIRTWIFVKDIDMFYQGLVKARREIFLQHDLREDTHYIASSGIEGVCHHRDDLISLDAYSILGLDRRQITYLNDFQMLCAAKNYHVTFERGTRIAFADRSHYHISGTTSIDQEGKALHHGNVLKQMERALENIQALLQAGGATLDDMMYLIIYLRDPADFNSIKAEIAQRLPLVPTIIVQAALSRPDWLIEIEGVAARTDHHPSHPEF